MITHADAGVDAAGMTNHLPPREVMLDLLTVFNDNFGSLFPCIRIEELARAVDADSGYAFLLNCIAATAARYSLNRNATDQQI
jgi:hypothetical protein